MAKQVTSENQEDIDALIRAADRGELIHHPEATIRRDHGAPLPTDEQAASLMAQSLAKLEKPEERRAEERTARRTWRIRVPEDLDDKAGRLAKKEGIPKSAIIRKAVARYVQAMAEQPTEACRPPHQDARAPHGISNFMDSWGRPSFMRSCNRLRVGDPARHAQNGQPVLSHPGGQILNLHARGTSLLEPAGKNRAGRAHRKNRRSPKRVCHRYPGKDPKPAHHIHKTPAITFTKHHHPSIRPTSNHETTINQHTPSAPTSADSNHVQTSHNQAKFKRWTLNATKPLLALLAV